MNNQSLFEKFNNKSVSLLGAGVSNTPLISMLIKLGANVVIRDRKEKNVLSNNVLELEKDGLKFICGDNYLDNISENYIFRSPGIRPDSLEIKEAIDKGSILTSEMEEFLKFNIAETIGVTGSSGKTTTTTLISLMLQASVEEHGKGNMFLGGNIGSPLFNRVCDIKKEDCVAIELSSFQLMTINGGIDVAVITNITPNHLNWHLDMEEYIDAKSNILNGCKKAVLNYSDPILREIGDKLDIPITYFSSKTISYEKINKKDCLVQIKGDNIVYYCNGKEDFVCKIKDIKLPGLHNIENYMAAIGATYGKVSKNRIIEIAQNFAGVQHRLQIIREKDGVKYINSSIDSTPERTAAALSALKDDQIVLIVGGYDKNLDYKPLIDSVIKHGKVRIMVINGDTTNKICDAIKNNPMFKESKISIYVATNFDDAVKYAASNAKMGETVLLSPAAASFDQFENFEKRGIRFSELVNQL